MKHLKILGIALILAGCGAVPDPAKLAPGFTGKTYDGKHFSLFDLAKEKPVVAVFLSPSDPDRASAVDELKILQRSHEGKVNVIALLLADEETTWRWAKEVGVTVLPDQFGDAMKKYKVTRSRSAILVNQGTELVQTWQDFSPAALQEASDLVSGLNKTAKVKLGVDVGRPYIPGPELRFR